MSFPLTAVVHHRAATLWLASTLVLFAALAPSLGVVLRSSAAGAVSIEVCSTLAAKLGKASQLLAKSSGQHAAPHCPLCVIPGNLAGLPPAIGGMLLAAAGGDAPISFAIGHLPPASPRLLALSRAPPFLA